MNKSVRKQIYISAKVRPVDVKLRAMVELRPERLFSPFGTDRGLQMRVKRGFGWTIIGLSDTDFLQFDREYVGYLAALHVNYSSTTAF